MAFQPARTTSGGLSEPIKRRYAEEGAPLDKGKMNRVTIGITVMILLAVFLFLGYPLLNLDREEIVLPGENSASDISDPGEGAGGGNAVQRVEVTAETVGRVVDTLTRPES